MENLTPFPPELLCPIFCPFLLLNLFQSQVKFFFFEEFITISILISNCSSNFIWKIRIRILSPRNAASEIHRPNHFPSNADLSQTLSPANRITSSRTMMKKKEKRARIHRNHAKSISFSQGSRARFNYTRRCWRKGRAKKKGEEGKKKRARSPRLVRCETRALTLASLFETLPHGRVVGNYLRPRVYRLRVIREDTTNGVSFELRQLRVAVYRFNGSLISVPCLYWPPLSASLSLCTITSYWLQG